MKRRRWVAAFMVLSLLLALGCTGKSGDAAFTLQVVPEELKGFAIAGQRIHYLVTLGEENTADPVQITASTAGAQVEVFQGKITAGQVAEVVVVPNKESVGKSISVEIQGTRGAVTEKKTLTFEVIEGEDDRKAYAEELLKMFLPYLREKQPELKIKEDTVWTGTMVSPQWLVVSHYLFFSEEWELHLEWHVMIAPDDWARIDLRHRFDEAVPSKAFEISSVSQKVAPAPMAIPEEVWR
ncbi:hypothetical protein KCG48_11685 [Proteiniclasticum sp. BAD-10]|uniref:Lipoprotein n=1 Tax=Proteiniclasticum sediminis TaxID=2804028 RepID=A0A941CRN7_9CLOT|nr:hypothetical protein [Proteiniclasticum sediminis]MBR0576977.1 hypothetical protein [Proteiniclasticum sediminis]